MTKILMKKIFPTENQDENQDKNSKDSKNSIDILENSGSSTVAIFHKKRIRKDTLNYDS